jgi:hypothetical protein
MRTVQQFEGFVSAAEAVAMPYRYVPFPVPLGCTRIDVSYQFAPVISGEGPCTVDIGLFDIRGTEPLTGGFRGWSGADRRMFSVGRETATPGYVAGPLPSGSWSVILGAYEVPPGGVRWWVTVEVESEEPIAKSAEQRTQSVVRAIAPAASARKAASGWYRGDLHSHSEHSDGANTIAEIAAFAKVRKLDFLAVTDHNTTTHHAVIDGMKRPPLLLIPGEEVTTYSGHANVWGLREWVDFRFTTDLEIHRLLKWVEARGRPFSINHPKTVGPPWKFTDPGFAIREVWQAPWRWYNWQSVREWDELLAAGRRVIPVGGSDAHSVPPAEPRHPHDIGDPTTWLWCEGGLSEESVLDAITAGRTAISDSPEGPFVTIEGPDERGGYSVRYRRAEGCWLGLVADGEPCWRVELTKPAGSINIPANVRWDRYLRAELRSPAPNDREDVRALSAPVWR